MFSTVFEQATCIDKEVRLRQLFGSDRLSLEDCASVVFEGSITLGSEIVFFG